MAMADTTLRVERPVYEQDQLNKAYDYTKPRSTFVSNVAKKCKEFSPLACAASTVPAVGWLSNYRWKADIVSDLIAGFTVAIMHIPQGMAYAMLGNVPPIVGIYMAFFPVLIYVLLGTSHHVSMGTFAVICLMTGKTVVTYSTNFEGTLEPPTAPFNQTDLQPQYSPIEVATAVTFMVGIYQLAMWVFRAGIVCTLLSDTLVSGFTTGAAVHVLTSQIKDLLGLEIIRYKGPFKIIYTYRDIIAQITTSNQVALLVSSITLITLVLNNEFIKPWLSKKTKFPVPIELIAIIIGTLASSYGSFATEYGLVLVGEIPTGLPIPAVPPLSLISKVALDSFTITMVAYTISMSMALIFAQKLSYEVDPNQELLAQGAGNLFGSFFSCMPFTASLSRSLIQQAVGGKTQLTSVFSCALLLVVLLWVGPLFEPLPRCVLASIIVVALKGMFVQLKDLPRFWRCSYLDGVVWLATFLTVVFVDIDFGLLTGVLLSLVSIFIQGMKPYICLMGVVPNTDLYLDLNRYKGMQEIHGIKIFHYCGGLNFASRTHFRREVYKLVGVNPQQKITQKERHNKIFEKALSNPSKIAPEDMVCSTVASPPLYLSSQWGLQGGEKALVSAGSLFQDGLTNIGFLDDSNGPLPCSSHQEPMALQYLIVDFSALSYIDPSGVKALHLLRDEFEKIDVTLFIAGISGPVFETLKKCEEMNGNSSPLKIFPTVHDAVICAQTKLHTALK